MSVCVASLVRNEGSRWLPSLLPAWQTFANEIVVLDDGSTDNTVELCKSFGCNVIQRSSAPAWGAETHARQELWQYAAATGCDWLFFLDADMVPANNPRLLFEAPNADCIAFRLYDLWAEDNRHLFYREDRFWRAHEVPRVWAVKTPDGSFEPQWSTRGVHCGHLPYNLPGRKVLVAPYQQSILHYGYLRPADRNAKARQYATVAEQLTAAEAEHAASILDTAPALHRLGIPTEYEVVFGGV